MLMGKQNRSDLFGFISKCRESFYIAADALRSCERVLWQMRSARALPDRGEHRAVGQRVMLYTTRPKRELPSRI